MKKIFIAIGLVISFVLGCISDNLINSKACLVQNIKLQGLAVIENQTDCTIKNVMIVADSFVIGVKDTTQ